MITTAALVLVILLTVVDSDGQHPMAYAASGIAVGANSIATFAVTEGSMNPARSLGAAIVYTVFVASEWRFHWIFWVGEIMGAITAAFLYRYFILFKLSS